MCGVSGINSLRYILLCGMRPSVRGGSGPLGPRCLVPFTRNRLTASLRYAEALKNRLRFRFTQTAPAGNGGPTAGRPHGRGFEVEKVVNVILA